MLNDFTGVIVFGQSTLLIDFIFHIIQICATSGWCLWSCAQSGLDDDLEAELFYMSVKWCGRLTLRMGWTCEPLLLVLEGRMGALL